MTLMNIAFPTNQTWEEQLDLQILFFSNLYTIEDHDQGHLYTNLEVPRLTCPGRGSNPGPGPPAWEASTLEKSHLDSLFAGYSEPLLGLRWRSARGLYNTVNKKILSASRKKTLNGEISHISVNRRTAPEKL